MVIKKEIDKDVTLLEISRQSSEDFSGRQYFYNQSCKVVSTDDDTFAVLSGEGYVGGYRFNFPGEKFTFKGERLELWLDVVGKITSTINVETSATLKQVFAPLNDYVDADGNQHYVECIAVIQNGEIEDRRVVSEQPFFIKELEVKLTDVISKIYETIHYNKLDSDKNDGHVLDIERLKTFDEYGSQMFLEDTCIVRNIAGTLFGISGGVGYLRGVRFNVETTQKQISDYPKHVWVELINNAFAGKVLDPTAVIVISKEEKSDYKTACGKEVYYEKVATVSSPTAIVDHRVIGTTTDTQPGTAILPYNLGWNHLNMLNLERHAGFYYQGVESDTVSNGYPEEKIGALLISHSNGTTTQTYHITENNKIYTRTYFDGTWSDWSSVYSTEHAPTKEVVGLGNIPNAISNDPSIDSDEVLATTKGLKKAYDLADETSQVIETHLANKVNPHGVTTSQINAVPTSRTISTTFPLKGGGNLNANRTLTVDAATTESIGVVQLSDAIDSESSTEASTPLAVKITYDYTADVETNINTHKIDKANPHGITAAQIKALPLTGGTVSGSLIFEKSKIFVNRQMNTTPAIDIALGDDDTGFNWIEDGIFEVWSNNAPMVRFNKKIDTTFKQNIIIEGSAYPKINVLKSDIAPTSYPNGFSMMEGTAGNGYETWSNLLTIKGSTSRRTDQLLIHNTGTKAYMKFRKANDASDGWTSWSQVYTTEFKPTTEDVNAISRVPTRISSTVDVDDLYTESGVFEITQNNFKKSEPPQSGSWDATIFVMAGPNQVDQWLCPSDGNVYHRIDDSNPVQGKGWKDWHRVILSKNLVNNASSTSTALPPTARALKLVNDDVKTRLPIAGGTLSGNLKIDGTLEHLTENIPGSSDVDFNDFITNRVINITSLGASLNKPPLSHCILIVSGDGTYVVQNAYHREDMKHYCRSYHKGSDKWSEWFKVWNSNNPPSNEDVGLSNVTNHAQARASTTISTTAPLTGGGSLASNRTIGINLSTIIHGTDIRGNTSIGWDDTFGRTTFNNSGNDTPYDGNVIHLGLHIEGAGGTRAFQIVSPTVASKFYLRNKDYRDGKWREWEEIYTDKNIPSASTSEAGIVRLHNGVGSKATDRAATAYAAWLANNNAEGRVSKSGDKIIGDLRVDGGVYPVTDTKDAEVKRDGYPPGISIFDGSGEWGYPGRYQTIVTFNHVTHRAMQFVTSKYSRNIYYRTVGDSNEWSDFHEFYTTYNKPDADAVGLGNVNNWTATSSLTDGSSNKYATAKATKDLNDLINGIVDDGGVHSQDKNNPHEVTVAQINAVPNTFKISTTAPLTGGGDLKKNLSLKVTNATTVAEGVVKLNTSIKSTSTSTAATPSAVKQAYDLANHNHPYLSDKGGTVNGDVVVDGVLHATKNVTIPSDVVLMSDSRVKTNIKQIKGALNKIRQLSGNTYYKTITEEMEAGFIAQEVQEVLPEAVGEVGGYLGVRGVGLTALLLEAVKELDAKVEDIRKIVER